jgi:hypothetical protein
MITSLLFTVVGENMLLVKTPTTALTLMPPVPGLPAFCTYFYINAIRSGLLSHLPYSSELIPSPEKNC